MVNSSSRISYHNDPVARIVMRSLFLLQLAAMFVVLGLCLLDLFMIAFIISIFTLSVLLTVLVWIYVRYQRLQVVCEKRILSRLVLKFEHNLHVEEFREQESAAERRRLVKAERQEIQNALSTLQRDYIQTGLGKATIKHAAITGVGPKHKERLAGYGILSAEHVTDRIAQLPGLGVEKCRALLSWRSSVVAKLESTKPSALPPEQLERIRSKYEELQDKNHAIEKRAIASQQILEHELISLKPELRSLVSITFPGYLSKSLASRGIVAALVAFALVIAQVVSSVSTVLAFASGK